jgi:hypothetical protein
VRARGVSHGWRIINVNNGASIQIDNGTNQGSPHGSRPDSGAL